MEELKSVMGILRRELEELERRTGRMGWSSRIETEFGILKGGLWVMREGCWTGWGK